MVSFVDTHELIDYQNTTSAEHEKSQEEKQITIRDSLRQLGDPCKSILLYFYYEQNTMEQIAERLGYTNADNAKNQKYKCLKRLKAVLNDKMKGYLKV